MNLHLEKQQIIEALQERDEEWLIFAFKKLLDLDQPLFSDEHRFIIKERLDAYEKEPNDVISFDDVRQVLIKEGRL